VKSSTSAGVFLGTPRYASPEQRLGAVVGTSSDVYSLGLLLLELLEGRKSFDESCRSRQEAAAALLGRCEPHFRLIGEMLAEGAEQRPSMAEVLRRLEALPAEEPAPPSLPDARDGAATPARRRILLLGSLAALLAAAALAAGLARRPARSPRARPAPALHLLTVRYEPPGAEVYLDGVRLGTTPLRLRVERGLPSLRLRLEKPGYRAVGLRASPESTAETVRLEPARPRAAPLASHRREPGEAHWQAGRAAFRSGSYERALREFA
jgi:serine/threonine protein kinase